MAGAWSLFFLVIRTDEEACFFGFRVGALAMTIGFLSSAWGAVFLTATIWTQVRREIQKSHAPGDQPRPARRPRAPMSAIRNKS